MTIPKTIEGREYKKFVESPTRGPNNTAIEVLVGNIGDIGVVSTGDDYDINIFKGDMRYQGKVRITMVEYTCGISGDEELNIAFCGIGEINIDNCIRI